MSGAARRRLESTSPSFMDTPAWMQAVEPRLEQAAEAVEWRLEQAAEEVLYAARGHAYRT